jgi:hypothetical protein
LSDTITNFNIYWNFFHFKINKIIALLHRSKSFNQAAIYLIWLCLYLTGKYNQSVSYLVIHTLSSLYIHLTNNLPYNSNLVLSSGDEVLSFLNDNWCYLSVDHFMMRRYTLYSSNIAYNSSFIEMRSLFNNVSWNTIKFVLTYTSSAPTKIIR